MAFRNMKQLTILKKSRIKLIATRDSVSVIDLIYYRVSDPTRTISRDYVYKYVRSFKCNCNMDKFTKFRLLTKFES